MSYLRIESVDSQKNRHRFYVAAWQPTLRDTWALICQWGRIGESPRGIRVRECAGMDDAVQLAARAVKLRERHSYMTK